MGKRVDSGDMISIYIGQRRNALFSVTPSNVCTKKNAEVQLRQTWMLSIRPEYLLEEIVSGACVRRNASRRGKEGGCLFSRNRNTKGTNRNGEGGGESAMSPRTWSYDHLLLIFANFNVTPTWYIYYWQ